MPKNKDLKRLVRSRMQKTGESYTSARSHILRQTDPSTAAAERPPETTPDRTDLARLAGMQDAAVRDATGRTWSEWVEVLDEAEAASLPHREIARLIQDEHSIGSWWAQSVTVGYERIRGLREVGQHADGSFAANKSKTFAVPISTLFRAFSVARTRSRWLPDVDWTVRKANTDKSLRLLWPDGTTVNCYFTAKGDSRSQVAIQHRGLADRQDIEDRKQFWAERLTALADALG